MVRNKFCRLIFTVMIGVILSSTGSKGRAAQVGQAAYQDNHCVTDAVRLNADAAFIKGAKVKDALRQKVSLDR